MAEIITFTNQKGGVGKTSLAMNFGIRLKIAGIVLSRHTDRFLLSREMKEMMRNTARQIHSRVFDSAIRQSIFKYAPRSNQTDDYDRFVLEYLRYAGYMKSE